MSNFDYQGELKRYISKTGTGPLCDLFVVDNLIVATNGVAMAWSSIGNLSNIYKLPENSSIIDSIRSFIINEHGLDFKPVELPISTRDIKQCEKCHGTCVMESCVCNECCGEKYVTLYSDYNTYRVPCKGCEAGVVSQQTAGDIKEIACDQCLNGYTANGNSKMIIGRNPECIFDVRLIANLLDYPSLSVATISINEGLDVAYFNSSNHIHVVVRADRQDM